MPFFWKLFFSTTLISAVFFSIGSFYITYSSFDNALQREMESIEQENDVMISSVKSELESSLKASIYQSDSEIVRDLEDYGVLPSDIAAIVDGNFSNDTSDIETWIDETIQSMTVSMYGEVIPFRITDSRAKVIAQSKWTEMDDDLLRKLKANNMRGCEVVRQGDEYFIHCASAVFIFDNTLYIENYRSITNIFNNRIQQQRSGMYITGIMLVSMAAVSFVVSKWLTKPISALSAASRRFSEGSFCERVAIRSNDEIGRLAADFNSMADRVETTVAELRDSAERQEAFVNSFAHELKTPLTSIIGYADVLRSKPLSDEQIIEYSHIIFQEGQRLEAMSMKLMELIVLKKQDFDFQTIPAKMLLRSVENTVRPIFRENNIQFYAKYENDRLLIEPDLIKTVCINLLDNARKSIFRDGRVWLMGKRVGDQYRISVIDNGRGMEQHELHKITNPFYMVDKSRARLQGGAGLGLSICAEIAALHDSALEFKSEPDKGTCVSVRLPTRR